jgi:hypothetical protein
LAGSRYCGGDHNKKFQISFSIAFLFLKVLLLFFLDS